MLLLSNHIDVVAGAASGIGLATVDRLIIMARTEATPFDDRAIDIALSSLADDAGLTAASCK